MVINLCRDDDTQLIFETLNDRGTPLLKADLIKNWIFQRGDDLDADTEQWPDTFWDDFDDDWWRGEVSQGRQAMSRIDIFMQYWLTMRLRDEVPTDAVFRRFTDYAGPQMTNLASTETLLTALRRDANTFRRFAQLSSSSAPGRFYARVIETMELAATSPLLLWMLSANHGVPADQVEIGLSALESWVIRRTLLRLTMKDINKMMVAILKKVETVDPDRAGDAVRDFLARQTADARVWPENGQVMMQLRTTRLYNNIRQSRLRVVLEAIERSLRSEKSEDVSLPSNLQIEHVMPRGWRTHWDSEPRLDHEAAAERDRIVDTLGNLTLITGKLNLAVSNRPWTDEDAEPLGGPGPDAGLGKRSLLNKHSVLLLSRRLTDGHPDEWTEASIAERSMFLAAHVCTVWPGPPLINSDD